MPGTNHQRAARAVLVSLVAAGTALVAGCSGGTTPGPTTTAVVSAPVPTATKTAPPAPVVPTVWPLTGVETDKVAQRPALAVKIENSTDARPQWGLEDADNVWEEVVEGGITRFVAVFQSKTPSRIEPIRSVRPMDAQVVGPLKGVFAFSGGQPPFIAGAKAAGAQVITMDAGNPGFHRDPARRAPHNVFADTKDLFAQASSSRAVPPPRQFVFAQTAAEATAATDGKPAKQATVHMSGAYVPGWTFDAGKHVYLRSERGVPSVSAAGTRLSATNVVILRVRVVQTKYKDPAGNPVPDTVLQGTGAATVLTGGKAVTGTWSKSSTTSPVKLTSGGKTVELAPGATWIELVPTTTGSVTLG